MTTARAEIFSPEEPGFYHCISRCVRRAFLCGFDRYTSKSFEHRKKWVRQRLKELLELFAVDCLAYAVMSTHLHSLLRNRPDLADRWSDDEVARRWRRLFPRRRKSGGAAEEPSAQEIGEITSDSALVTVYRRRLSDLSWFNRCLNEHIARRANAEDKCTGRFWEGRFKCIRLETSAAILACSVYVDLNPIRAGLAETLEDSNFTSVQDRIGALSQIGPCEEGPRLISHDEALYQGLPSDMYLRLVAETGSMVLCGATSLSPDLSSLLDRLKIRPDGWSENARRQGRLFRRIIGSVESIRRFAANRGKAWFQGHAAARLVFA